LCHMREMDVMTTAILKDKDLCALDEMFSASRRYRSSHEYMELPSFITKLRRYAPCKGLLLNIQNNPSSGLTLTNPYFKRGVGDLLHSV
jgi:hypothetical protein